MDGTRSNTILAEQDKCLDGILQILQRIKANSEEIGRELDRQHGKLEELDTTLDQTDQQMKTVIDKTKRRLREV
jgi:hypothetical protein